MKYVEYLKIPFKHLGRDYSGADCFGLLRLFYQKELNVILKDFTNYSEDWAKKGKNYFLEMYREWGFSRVSKGNFKFGDAVLFKTNNVISHVGIVLDDIYFIHMSKKGCSIHSYIDGEWGCRLFGAFRYIKRNRKNDN